MMYQKLKVAKLLEGEGAPIREKRGHSSEVKTGTFLHQKRGTFGVLKKHCNPPAAPLTPAKAVPD